MGLLSTFSAASGRAFGFTRSAIAAATDAFFNRVTLLLPGNGTNGAQNNTFLDSSTNNFTITRNGNTTQGTFSPFSQTGWSVYLNGSSSLRDTSTSAVYHITGNFTVEGWYWFDSAAVLGDLFGIEEATAGWAAVQVQLTTSRTLALNMATTAGAWAVSSTSTATVTLGTWNHIAVTRSGSAINLWLNGVSILSASNSNALMTTGDFTIIGGRDSGAYITGYVSNFRFVNGTALYTSAFTPSTAPLTTTSQGATATEVELLTCQSNRFVDNSSNAFTLTVNGTPSVQAFSPFYPVVAYTPQAQGGSGYFDGTGDYLSSTISAISGTFTIEFWFYRPSSGSNFCFTIGDSQTGGNTSAEVYIGTSGTVLNYWTNNNAQITGTPAAAGQWVYLAVTRDGSNVVRLYQNGTQVGGTYTQSGTLSTALRIGVEWYGGVSTGTTNGYIGHFRVSNSVRTVTTVPTAPFTSDANTVFLANFTNAGIIDATGKNVLETVGNAQISTTQSKFGGSSMYFDGAGDYLTSPNSQNYLFGTGDFTIEGWIYFSSLSATYQCLAAVWLGASNYGWNVSINNANVSFAYGNGGGSSASTTFTWAASTSTWYHFALTRSNGSVKCFINGTQIGSTATITSNITSGTALYIGANQDGGLQQYWNGYIDDLRITKGYARYTANFTAPTAALPLQ